MYLYILSMYVCIYIYIYSPERATREARVADYHVLYIWYVLCAICYMLYAIVYYAMLLSSLV